MIRDGRSTGIILVLFHVHLFAWNFSLPLYFLLLLPPTIFSLSCLLLSMCITPSIQCSQPIMIIQSNSIPSSPLLHTHSPYFPHPSSLYAIVVYVNHLVCIVYVLTMPPYATPRPRPASWLSLMEVAWGDVLSHGSRGFYPRKQEEWHLGSQFAAINSGDKWDKRRILWD